MFVKKIKRQSEYIFIKVVPVVTYILKHIIAQLNNITPMLTRRELFQITYGEIYIHHKSRKLYLFSRSSDISTHSLS